MTNGCHITSHCGKTTSKKMKRGNNFLDTRKTVRVDGQKFTAHRKAGDKYYTLKISGHGVHNGVYKYCGQEWLDYSYEDRQLTRACPKCRAILTQAFVHNIDEPEDDEEDGCPCGCDVRGVVSFYCKKCCSKRHSPF